MTANSSTQTADLDLGDGGKWAGKLTLLDGSDKVSELMVYPFADALYSRCYLPPDKDMNDSGAILLSEKYIKGKESYTYGTTFPGSSTAEEGQIFFKINENGTKENETDRGYWVTATPYIYRLKNA
jgi:hypothetical protein